MLPCFKDVYTLAYRVYTSHAPLRMGIYSLREAYDLAVGDQRLLRDLAQIIVTLCDLVRQASFLLVAPKWILNAFKETPRCKSACSDSPPSDHSADHARHHRQKDSSSNRGASKRTSFTLHSDSSRPPLWRASRQKDHRQALHRIYRTSERNDIYSPPFPPHTARRRAHLPSIPTPLVGLE